MALVEQEEGVGVALLVKVEPCCLQVQEPLTVQTNQTREHWRLGLELVHANHLVLWVTHHETLLAWEYPASSTFHAMEATATMQMPGNMVTRSLKNGTTSSPDAPSSLNTLCFKSIMHCERRQGSQRMFNHPTSAMVPRQTRCRFNMSKPNRKSMSG
jgi:hypothetical protein